MWFCLLLLIKKLRLSLCILHLPRELPPRRMEECTETSKVVLSSSCCTAAELLVHKVTSVLRSNLTEASFESSDVQIARTSQWWQNLDFFFF